jgi:hypothetical protein
MLQEYWKQKHTKNINKNSQRSLWERVRDSIVSDGCDSRGLSDGDHCKRGREKQNIGASKGWSPKENLRAIENEETITNPES